MKNTRFNFLKKFIKSPNSIGAVTPSSSFLARKINKVVDKLESVPIIELGGGTGALTAGIKHRNPKVIEIDPVFSGILKEKFPELKILNSCAIEEINKIDQKCGIVTSIPLSNNPMKEELMAAISKKYLEGKVRWCIIISYFFTNPLKGIEFKAQKIQSTCLLNVPPAYLWVYQ